MAIKRQNRNETLKKPATVNVVFSDDQVIIADTEDTLQKPAHKLNQIITEYGLTTAAEKKTRWHLKGRNPERTKIVIDNKTIEQVNLFKYLENMISYEREMDIDNKLNKWFKFTCILNNVFRPQNPLRKQE